MVNGSVVSNSIPLSYAISAAAQGRLALPVDPSSLIYSYLRNITGIPAPEGSNGIDISRLNVLDALIELMRQVRETPDIVTEDLPVYMQEAMIGTYQAQILEAREARTEMPYVQAPLADSGLLFSMSM